MIDCKLTDLGKMAYGRAWDIQKSSFNRNISNKAEGQKGQNELFIVEHEHVYTFGKSAKRENLLVSNERLTELDAAVFDIERGGDITYHGPGQLVVYPVFDLETLGIGVKKFVGGIEEAIINSIGKWGIESTTVDDRIGVWLDVGKPKERKIAAIGIKCSRFITMHGLALNVNTDLGMFQHIVPCGIQDKGVTSMEMELGEKIDMNDVKKELINQFAYIFGLNFNK